MESTLLSKLTLRRRFGGGQKTKKFMKCLFACFPVPRRQVERDDTVRGRETILDFGGTGLCGMPSKQKKEVVRLQIKRGAGATATGKAEDSYCANFAELWRDEENWQLES